MLTGVEMLAALPDDKRQLLRDALSGKTEKELEGLVEQVQALMEPASPQRRVDDVDKSLEELAEAKAQFPPL